MLASSEERPEEPPEELRLGDIEEAVVRSGLTWFNSFFPVTSWTIQLKTDLVNTFHRCKALVELLRHQLLFFCRGFNFVFGDFGGTRFGKC